MKRLILVGVLGALAALTACDEPAPREESMMEAAPEPVIVEEAPAAEDMAAPASAESAIDARPADSTALPPEKRSSEETVQPESETLFY